MKKTKPLTGSQKRKQKRDQKEKEEQEERELVADVERLKLGPSPLWKFIVDYADIFEKHVLLSGKLNRSDIKMFYECCRASRRAVMRAKIELSCTFSVKELSSVSTLEMAWDRFPWGARKDDDRFDDEDNALDQNYFSARVCETNDLALLKWAREVKQCDWNWKTTAVASGLGNLAILTYAIENECECDERACALSAKFNTLQCLVYLRKKNCPWDERVCAFAHENAHVDVLAFAVETKCPGFQAYERFVPK